MSWTLLMTDEEGNPLQETFVLLDDELVEYFGGLEGVPVFRGFQGLDPDKDTGIDAEGRGRLEGRGDVRPGEGLGWNGLLELLQKLAHLLHLARGLGLEIWALPDD